MSGLEQDKQHAFDAFCKRIVRNESINAHREIYRLGQLEVNFSDLSQTDEMQLQYIDVYAPERRTFAVLNFKVEIENELLVWALSALAQPQRDIVLLAYLFELPDVEIANQLGISRSTVQYRRTNTLKQLQKLMGEYEHA